jgi:soluble lytic murein transglycosylase-like protein
MEATLAALFLATSTALGLPPGLLSGLCYVESAHNPNAFHRDDNGADSIGICQIRIATARMVGFRGTEKQLRVPAINIAFSGRYLRRQLVRYNFDLAQAIAAYNSGSLRLDQDGNIRNHKYVRAVLKAWMEER